MGDCADDILGTLFQDESKATLMKFMLPSVAILIPGGLPYEKDKNWDRQIFRIELLLGILNNQIRLTSSKSATYPLKNKFINN